MTHPHSRRTEIFSELTPFSSCHGRQVARCNIHTDPRPPPSLFLFPRWRVCNIIIKDI